MVESRWGRRIGPGLAALGALALITTTTLGAREGTWDPPPCRDGAILAAVPPGTWWRLDPQLDGGVLVGQRLALGGPGLARPRRMTLPAESFAAGPFDGLVLVGIDDGRRSRLSLVDPIRGCSRAIASSTDVVRQATLTPDRTAVIESRVDRRTRADLGVYRRSLEGRGAPARLLPPIATDPRYGPTWTTDLVWSADGRALAVQSCGAIACRVRVTDPRSGRVRLLGSLDQGDLVGFAEGPLIVREACGGLPCAVVAVDVATGERMTLEPAAWQVALVTDAAAHPRLVLETGRDGRFVRAMDLDGRNVDPLAPDARGRRVVPGAGRSQSAVEIPAGVVVLAPDGRLPDTGPTGAALRHLANDTTVELEEVLR
jgi:hypothetical protein